MFPVLRAVFALYGLSVLARQIWRWLASKRKKAVRSAEPVIMYTEKLRNDMIVRNLLATAAQYQIDSFVAEASLHVVVSTWTEQQKQTVIHYLRDVRNLPAPFVLKYLIAADGSNWWQIPVSKEPEVVLEHAIQNSVVVSAANSSDVGTSVIDTW